MRRRNFIAWLGGALITGPRASIAQPATLRVIGYLSSASPATYPPAYLAAFRKGLEDIGYTEDKNLKFEYGWADDHYDRLPQLAADLVRKRVDVIAATGGLVSALAAKDATSTIPIVFTMGDDPVSAGVVASFSRPGGNITGVSFFVVQLGAKLFELAAQLVPNGSPIAVLANPKRPSYGPVRKTLEEAAAVAGRRLEIVDCGAEQEFDAAFATLTQVHAGALVVTSDPLYLDRRDRIVSLVAAHAIPAVYAWHQYVSAGGLMSYGPNLAAVYHQAGVDAGKILGGQRPADIPVEQPTKFDLVINLKTAKALDLTVPRLLLAQADEVIE